MEFTGREEGRSQPSLKLPAMYTLLRARPTGSKRYCWTGHIYDISADGMRFELDQVLEPRTPLEVRGMLPGAKHITFRATGHITCLHEKDRQVGPFRMAMTFESFSHEIDRQRLSEYLHYSGLRAA